METISDLILKIAEFERNIKMVIVTGGKKQTVINNENELIRKHKTENNRNRPQKLIIDRKY